LIHALAWHRGQDVFRVIGVGPVMLPEGKIFLIILQIGIFYRSIVVTPLWNTVLGSFPATDKL
jgi:hypothetical protein